jgi:hypothetical protein
MVWAALFPAATEPQLMVFKAFVQALSEYTPRFGEVVTSPDEERVLFTLVAANTVTANARIAKKTITPDNFILRLIAKKISPPQNFKTTKQPIAAPPIAIFLKHC